MRRAGVVAATMAVLAIPVGHAVAAGEVVVTTTANSQFAPHIVAMPQGASLRLVQLDPTARHDVVSRVAPRGKPLFASEKTLVFGETELVGGVERLRPAIYAFTCSIHQQMAGTLIVRE